MLRTECDLKDQIDNARDVAALGFVLLLICLVTYAWLNVQTWILVGISLVGIFALIDGLRIYFKGKRGLRK